MVRIPAGIHKKTKHTNLETAANAACVNECTCYWAFTHGQLVDVICGNENRIVFVWKKSKEMNELYKMWCDRRLE